MADQNENEKFSADVGDFVDTLLERQTAFEAEIRGKLDALDQLLKEALAKSLATIEALIEKRMKRPDASRALSN